jgi:D-lyxose ketol-isomerase
MDNSTETAVRSETIELVRRSGISVSDEEFERMTVVDFGLGDLRSEGVQLIDIVRTDLLRVTVLVLLPHQTLPQHCHPSYDGLPGKEENIRAVWGTLRVYTPGVPTMRHGRLVQGKEQYYTARHETVLAPGESMVVDAGVHHWFQAGPEGSVSFGFYNRVDESRNVFSDPNVTTACGVELVRCEQ